MPSNNELIESVAQEVAQKAGITPARARKVLNGMGLERGMKAEGPAIARATSGTVKTGLRAGGITV